LQAGAAAMHTRRHAVARHLDSARLISIARGLPAPTRPTAALAWPFNRAHATPMDCHARVAVPLPRHRTTWHHKAPVPLPRQAGLPETPPDNLT
jgi:hypothetical protein